MASWPPPGAPPTSRPATRPGRIVVVDGAQSVPRVPVNVADLGCDFMAGSRHQMLGPVGVGVPWGRRELLEAMPAYQFGSNMPHAAAIAFLEQARAPALREHELAINARVFERLQLRRGGPLAVRGARARLPAVRRARTSGSGMRAWNGTAGTRIASAGPGNQRGTRSRGVGSSCSGRLIRSCRARFRSSSAVSSATREDHERADRPSVPGYGTILTVRQVTAERPLASVAVSVT